MNTKIAIYSVFAIGAMALFGATLAVTSAAGFDQDSNDNRFNCSINNRVGFEKMLENKAEVLGLSLDEIKALREDGKTFAEILEQQGLDIDSFHEQMQAKHIEILQAEVDAGNITQEQMDARLERAEKRHEQGFRQNSFRKGSMHRGFQKAMQE